MENRKRSAAFNAAASHWANKKPKQDIPEGEDVHVEVQDDRESVPQKKLTSPFRLISNPTFDDEEESTVNKDTLMIHSLIGTKDLKETFQFNFSIDVEFLLSFLHPDFSKLKKPITFITGDRLISQQTPEVTKLLSNYNAFEVVAHVPNRFGTHHTKMMINFFEDDTLEIVIMTCNFTKLDFLGLTQMCWTSGRLAISSKPPAGDSCVYFRRDLQNYLKRYRNVKLDELANALDSYDFSSVDVELMASVPGTFDTSEVTDTNEVYGYGKLLQILRRNGLMLREDTSSSPPRTYNFLAQVSSIAYPYAVHNGKCASIWTHTLCPIICAANSGAVSTLRPGNEASEAHQKTHNYKPHIVFPTEQEVLSSNMGIMSGSAIHYEYKKTPAHRGQHEQNIKPYLRKWRTENSNARYITGRENIPPHVKLYMCDDGNDFDSLRWVLLCSHNLSKQAWGASKGSAMKQLSESKYEVANYELGVFVKSQGESIKPVYGVDSLASDEVPVRLPFVLPPQKYEVSEKPWSSSQLSLV